MQDTGTAGLYVGLTLAFFTAWNGLLSLILGRTMKKVDDNSKDREDHCIPRPECERTHKGVDDRLDRIERNQAEGFSGIHKRLDKFLGNKE